MAVPEIHLWRIAKETRDYAANDMSGGGAATTGGRWNSKGKPVVYAASSIALATLETLAHIGDDIACRNRFLVRIDIPDAIWKKREVTDVRKLPASWAAEPHGLSSVDHGDRWLGALRSALLLVPSVIVPEEWNILINPLHPDARRIATAIVRQFVYDPRLG